MDPDEILRRLRAAKDVLDTKAVPTTQLYEFLKAYEDSVRVLMSEGELLTYIDQRMALAEQFGA